ncbi:MAG: SSU ribosomal protein S15p (S13e), partial [uncultured Rubrobacteraceae bacterium]
WRCSPSASRTSRTICARTSTISIPAAGCSSSSASVGACSSTSRKRTSSATGRLSPGSACAA